MVAEWLKHRKVRDKELYKSPIEKLYGELQTQIEQEEENMVMKAIRNVGINVDKEELIKALQYDRNQYTKGYKDGKKDVLDKISAEIENHCGLTKENHCKYCPYCNSLMGVRELLEIIDKYKAESEK